MGKKKKNIHELLHNRMVIHNQIHFWPHVCCIDLSLPSYTAEKPLPTQLLLLLNSIHKRLSVETIGSGSLSPQNRPEHADEFITPNCPAFETIQNCPRVHVTQYGPLSGAFLQYPSLISTWSYQHRWLRYRSMEVKLRMICRERECQFSVNYTHSLIGGFPQ